MNPIYTICELNSHTMVFVIDEGSEFDAPLDKIWKLNEAHGTDNQKIHPNTRNIKVEPISSSSNNMEGTIASWDDVSQGQPMRIKVKFTNAFPVGFLAEMLEGPMADSKFFNYYIPKGNKTGVTLVGDLKSSMVPENQIRDVVLAYFD